MYAERARLVADEILSMIGGANDEDEARSALDETAQAEHRPRKQAAAMRHQLVLRTLVAGVEKTTAKAGHGDDGVQRHQSSPTNAKISS
jgi:hypothetical protein